MEPVRPRVDRYVSEILARRSFVLDDFYETRQEVCRVTTPLARELAAAAARLGAGGETGRRGCRGTVCPLLGRAARTDAAERAQPIG